MKALGGLCERLRNAGLLVECQGSFDDDFEIDHLAIDSRKVGPRGLFVAVRGVDTDGHLFIDKAVQNGAIAVVCEAMPGDREDRFPGVAFVRVTQARAASAELAAAFYDDPSQDLVLIGITGTNGKTTTAFLCHHALTRLGSTAGMIGTVEVRIGNEVLETSLTTPDPVEINRLLRSMAKAGCSACVMEISSHALHQDRARALLFEVGVFTNLTQDHLDYHETFEEYLLAKKRLFDMLPEAAAAIFNADDEAATKMVADTSARRISYGLGPECSVRGEILANSVDGLELRIDGDARKFRLTGRFNAYNVLAAYAAVRALTYDSNAVLSALEEADPVPGRLEVLRFEDDTTVVVDYAHTPDALENVLKSVRETKAPETSLWCIFGCGGDRDREKRPMMGAIAERYSDRIVVTSDNPRTEDPEAIIAEILTGLERPNRAVIITDRAEAIQFAAQNARQGDVVLVAGKGHEAYQIIGTTTRPFDDRKVAQEAFSTRIANNFGAGA